MISNLILVLLLVLSNFNVCTPNILSLTNRVHYTALSSIAENHHIHLFALTETWITPFTTSAELLDSVPTGFSLLSFPRPACPNNKNKIIGGGTVFLVHDSCRILSSSSPVFKSFEISLSLLNFLNLDSQYSMFIVLLPHLPRLFLSHSFSLTFKLLSHWQLPLLMTFLLLVISTFMLMIIKILRQINFYLSLVS